MARTIPQSRSLLPYYASLVCILLSNGDILIAANYAPIIPFHEPRKFPSFSPPFSWSPPPSRASSAMQKSLHSHRRASNVQRPCSPSTSSSAFTSIPFPFAIKPCQPHRRCLGRDSSFGNPANSMLDQRHADQSLLMACLRNGRFERSGSSFVFVVML